MGDSQASFSKAATSAIRQVYNYRCVICLTEVQTSQCAHIIDAASAGERPVRNAVRLGILPEDYKRNSATNGMVQCPTCHSYFTQNFVVLSLPIPVLEYLQTYVADTPKSRQKPLHKVFDLLLDALSGTEVPLPDPKPIFPYLGLFTMVTLNPTRLATEKIPTLYSPNLSIIRGNKFVPTHSNAPATARNASRIFDPLSVDDNKLNVGYIPLSPNVPGFKENRFWRLPLPACAILAALIERLQYDSSECEDIILACNIRDILSLQSHGAYPEARIGGGDGPGGGSGPSGGGGDASGACGDGPSRGGRRLSKRTIEGGKEDGSSGKGLKKARATRGYKSAACGAFGDTSGIAFRTRSRRRRQPDNLEVAFSTSNLDCSASAQSADLSRGDSDSEDGLSVSAVSPHGKDNPDEWRFGPSFTTHKIVFTARANGRMQEIGFNHSFVCQDND